MPQAKTLSEKELKLVLTTIERSRYAARDRAMVLMSFYAGMRVGEIAALKFGDVVSRDGAVKEVIRLSAEQTKGNKGRDVVLSERLRKALTLYVKSMKNTALLQPFFPSQRCRSGFSANSMCQHFGHIYKRAGIDGASSHSGRRTFITTLANKGVGVRVLMVLAGHQNMSTTQRYIDVNDLQIHQAVNLIA